MLLRYMYVYHNVATGLPPCHARLDHKQINCHTKTTSQASQPHAHTYTHIYEIQCSPPQGELKNAWVILL